MTPEKIPPSAVEVEKYVLGAFFVNRKIYLKYSVFIIPDYFYSAANKIIFEYMICSGCTDFVVMSEKYPQYAIEIAEMVEKYSHGLYLEAEIEILKDRYERRRLIETATTAETAAFGDYERGASEIIDETLSKINNNYTPAGKPELLCSIAPQVLANLETQELGEGTGYKTGLIDVDRVLGGFCNKELCIIAARPSMGKTSFALQIIRHNSITERIPVLFFSLEMSREAITGRILFSEAEANYDNALRGYKNQLPAVRAKYETALNNSPLFIDDTPGTTINHIQTKIENYVKNYGVKMIVIDRIEYIKTLSHSKSTHEQISEISKGLCYIAKKFNIPIILIVQLNRGTEHRENKIPELSDLRGSGSLEEDAVKVLMLYRDDYYNRDSEKKGITEILIRKNQNGRTGYCEVIYKGETMNFYSISRDNPEVWENNI